MELPTQYYKLAPRDRRAVRLRYIELQKGKCWFCKGDLKKEPPKRVRDMRLDLKLFPKGFLSSPIHLQHNHNTGLTEGAVHGYCNGVLWQYFQR